MNLPNKLTLSRIGLTFVFMFFLFTKWHYGKAMAIAVFALASFTDYLDGMIAKRRGLVSDFGKFMDPIADKVLILAAFLAFVEMGIVPAWMVLIIIFREFIILGLRILGIIKGSIVSASRAGKHKTVSQIVAVFFILVYLLIKEHAIKIGFWTQKAESVSCFLIFFLMLVAVTLTLISGASYISKNRRLFR
ncbi:MAG: CDP-diacylglycerol--glycerol-3-phosphate 3-phosphatidyltransferase [Candidatus Omnitrophica bacterium]|nr:CDP-diacylglycerol--glycerol-3-phosphate 3-phosphatidyltransferase [Candidatus Omnitrophota bacterium]